MSLFDGKRAAGEELSKYLNGRIDVGTVVIPGPNACEIGLAVAENQDANVEVRLSDFIRAPDFPEARIGAVVEDGTLWIDDGLKTELDVSRGYIESSARIRSNSLKEVSLENDIVSETMKEGSAVIVSPGIKNGFKEAAVAGSLIKDGFEEVYVVSPVQSTNMLADLDSIASSIFSIYQVPVLNSIESCYEEKSSDTKARGNRKQVA